MEIIQALITYRVEFSIMAAFFMAPAVLIILGEEF